MTDPLDFQFPERFDEPATKLIGASADPGLGHAEAQEDLPVLANLRAILLDYCDLVSWRIGPVLLEGRKELFC